MGIQVAEEISKLGYVKNLECIKCHICIGACPHQVLQTSLRKNKFHKNGSAVIPPAALSPSISWLQIGMAVIMLMVFGFNLGGNISFSLGFIAGFLIIHIWQSRKISALEALIILLLAIGMYFRHDMSDFRSLAKGLIAISIFLLAARNLNFSKGIEFIKTGARTTRVPALVLTIVFVAGCSSWCPRNPLQHDVSPGK